MKITCVVGARPNFMKMAPIVKELKKQNVEYKLIHTGQHYDAKMSDIFFKDLELPEPDVWLEVGSHSPATQFGKIMIRLEEFLMNEKTDFVIVVGDVTSTAAAAITASKMHIPIAHVEAGLRSFDRDMPEEINRITTDHISNLLFATEVSGVRNLLREGIEKTKIHLVGNVMIDTLISLKPRFENKEVLERLGLVPGKYAVLTLHRPSNVDNPDVLSDIMKAIRYISKKFQVVFPVHPRTRKNLEEYEISTQDINLLSPMGYLDFMGLFSNSRMILTDSGGIQEEATILKVPCLTLRENTERPVTVSVGINKVVGTCGKRIIQEAERIISESKPNTTIPDMWDGKAAERIIQILLGYTQ